jgi:hypothetical protein
VKKILQGTITFTYEGDADDLSVVNRAYVAMQSMERSLTRQGFIGWSMPIIYVVKKKQKKRVVRT